MAWYSASVVVGTIACRAAPHSLTACFGLATQAAVAGVWAWKGGRRRAVSGWLSCTAPCSSRAAVFRHRPSLAAARLSRQSCKHACSHADPYPQLSRGVIERGTSAAANAFCRKPYIGSESAHPGCRRAPWAALTRTMGRAVSIMSASSMYWQSVDGMADIAYCCSAARFGCGQPCLSTVCAARQPRRLSSAPALGKDGCAGDGTSGRTRHARRVTCVDVRAGGRYARRALTRQHEAALYHALQGAAAGGQASRPPRSTRLSLSMHARAPCWQGAPRARLGAVRESGDRLEQQPGPRAPRAHGQQHRGRQHQLRRVQREQRRARLAPRTGQAAARRAGARLRRAASPLLKHEPDQDATQGFAGVIRLCAGQAPRRHLQQARGGCSGLGPRRAAARHLQALQCFTGGEVWGAPAPRQPRAHRRRPAATGASPRPGQGHQAGAARPLAACRVQARAPCQRARAGPRARLRRCPRTAQARAQAPQVLAALAQSWGPAVRRGVCSRRSAV